MPVSGSSSKGTSLLPTMYLSFHRLASWSPNHFDTGTDTALPSSLYLKACRVAFFQWWK